MEEKKKESFFETMKRTSKNEKEEKKRVLEAIKNDRGIYTYTLGLSFMLWMSIFLIFILSFACVFANNIEKRIETGIIGILVSVILMIVYGVELRKLLKK